MLQNSLDDVRFCGAVRRTSGLCEHGQRAARCGRLHAVWAKRRSLSASVLPRGVSARLFPSVRSTLLQSGVPLMVRER